HRIHHELTATITECRFFVSGVRNFAAGVSVLTLPGAVSDKLPLVVEVGRVFGVVESLGRALEPGGETEPSLSFRRPIAGANVHAVVSVHASDWQIPVADDAVAKVVLELRILRGIVANLPTSELDAEE